MLRRWRGNTVQCIQALAQLTVASVFETFPVVSCLCRSYVKIVWLVSAAF